MAHARKFLRQGAKVDQRHNFGWALNLVDRALKADPTFEEAWTERIRLLVALKRAEEARATFLELMELVPGRRSHWELQLDGISENALVAITEAFFAQHHLDIRAWQADLLPLFRNNDSKAIEQACNDFASSRFDFLWEQRVDFVFSREFYSEYMSCLHYYLGLHPEQSHIWKKAGDGHDALGEWKDAVNCYQKADELNPKLALSAEYMSNLFTLMGVQPKQESVGDRIKRLKAKIKGMGESDLKEEGFEYPEGGARETAIVNRAEMLLEKKLMWLINKARWAEAENVAIHLSALFSGEPPVSVLYQLGRILLKLGRPEEARERLARVVEKEPRHLPALLALGRLARDEGDTNQAFWTFRKAAEIELNIEVVGALVHTLIEVKKYAEGARYLGLALGQKGGEPQLLDLKAELEEAWKTSAPDSYRPVEPRKRGKRASQNFDSAL